MILRDQVVELGAAFGLQHGLVEVEEGVSSEGDLRSSERRGRQPEPERRAAAAAGAAGAEAAGTRAPSQPAAAVAGVQLASRQHSSLVPFFQTSSPVPFCQLSMAGAAIRSGDTGLRAGGSGERSDCKHHRHFIQFLHGSPLGEKAAAALRIKDALSDHHPKR